MSTTTMLFQRPYCGKQLEWYILHDEAHPTRGPDVVFADDPAFSPLLAEATPEQQQLRDLLDTWDTCSTTPSGSTTSSSMMDTLIGLLLALYAQHNKARIAAAVTDERVLFELSMVDGLGCTDVLLTGPNSAGLQQACFTLPVPVDLAPAKQLLACMKKQQQQQQQQQQQHQQHQQQEAGQEEQFLLTVAFPVTCSSRAAGGATDASTSASGSGSSGQLAPRLQLHAPPWFGEQLPHLTLPAWDPHASLMEYVPFFLAERVQAHLAEYCPVAVQRYEFMQGLSALLGPPLEVNMAPGGLSTSSSTSSNSSKGGGSSVTGRPGSAGGSAPGMPCAAAGAAAAVFLAHCDQQPLLLYVELPRSYPSEAPVLRLQHLKRQGPDSNVALPHLPWSPRWPTDEQVARTFNFVKQQAAAAAAAAAMQAGPPAAAGAAPASLPASPAPPPAALGSTYTQAYQV